MTRIDRQMLGAYAAKQCPFRLFRENDPTEPAVAAEPDEALQELFDDGITFEADIVAELVEQFGTKRILLLAWPRTWRIRAPRAPRLMTRLGPALAFRVRWSRLSLQLRRPNSPGGRVVRVPTFPMR